jgi:deoxyribonuclease IV
MTRLFGGHTIDTGGIDMAARRAAGAQMRTLQIFTTIPKFYGDKASIRPERAERFKTALAATLIEPRHVMAHAAYVLNTATPNEDQWLRARDGLAKELERSTTLGIGAICFHPGATTDGDREAASMRIATAMIHALEAVPAGTTRLLVENTAGAGSTFGRTAAEVGAILHGLPAHLRARAGYGLDTCHLFASGYDLRESPAAIARVLDEFEDQTGERPGFFHLNDSAGALGSNRDRHVLIGDGQIGVEPFRWLLADERTSGIPLILETPQLNEGIDKDDPAPDPYDVQMMALLEQLAPRE